jgi:transcriptional regulator with XRE-family HTH domain
VLATTTLQLRSPDKLRAAMEKAGSSTRVLAKAADCSPSRIGQLIQGKDTGVSAGTAVAIAAALAVETRDLFEFPDGDALIRLGLIRDV